MLSDPRKSKKHTTMNKLVREKEHTDANIAKRENLMKCIAKAQILII